MEVRDDAPHDRRPERGERPDQSDGEAALHAGGRAQRLLRSNQRCIGRALPSSKLRAGRVQLHHLRAHLGPWPVVHERDRGRERHQRQHDCRSDGDADEPPPDARALAGGRRHDAPPAASKQ